MMFKNIFLKTLYEKRWVCIGWAVAVAFVSYITIIFFPTLSQQSLADSLTSSVPQSLQAIVGTSNDFTTIAGYIGQQIFGPNIVILTMVMSVILFLGVSSGDEERGTLKTMLTFPVSRKSVFLQKYLAVVLIIAAITVAIVIGLWIGLLQIGETASVSRILESAVACWLVNTAYGTVAFALAMALSRHSLTIAIASGYAILSFIISSLAVAVKQLHFIDMFSIFHYYNNPQIMTNGLNISNTLIICCIIVALLIFGLFGFVRRDIKS